MDNETRRRVNQAYEKLGLIAPIKESPLEEFGQAIGAGSLDVIRAIGASATELEPRFQSLEKWAERKIATSQNWEPYEGYSPSDLSLTGVARTVGQSIPTTAGTLGVGALGTAASGGNPLVGGFAAASFIASQNFGDTKRYYEQSGMNENTATVLAAFSSAAEGAIELAAGPEATVLKALGKQAAREALEQTAKKYGQSAIKNIGRYFLTGAAKGAAGEIAEEFTQFYTRELTRLAGSGKFTNMNAKQVKDTIFAAGIPGALFGGISEVSTNPLNENIIKDEVEQQPGIENVTITENETPVLRPDLEETLSLEEEQIKALENLLGEQASQSIAIAQTVNVPTTTVPTTLEEGVTQQVENQPEAPAIDPNVTQPLNENILANPLEDPSAREFMNTVDYYREKQGEPKRQTVEEWNQGAQEMIATTPDLWNQASKGELDLNNPVTTRAIIQLMETRASEDLASGDQDRIFEALNVGYQYRTKRADIARAMRAGFDPTKSPAQAVKGAVNGMLIVKDQKPTVEQANKVSKQMETIKTKLAEKNIDLDNLTDDQALNPETRSEIARTAREVTASKFDKAYEYWINAILSGPSTHGANIIGNTALAFYELTVQRGMEAFVNMFAKKPTGATWGEFRHMFRGLKTDIKDGFSKGAIAFSTEMPVSDDVTKLENNIQKGAIGGTLGRIIRFPTRALLWADEVAKATLRPIEAASFAYRQAKARGLTAEEDITDYITQQVSNSESLARKYADNRAKELTFQSEPGTFVKLLQAANKKYPLLQFIFPFLRTPGNIIKISLRKSPLGIFPLGYNLAKGNYDGDTQVKRIAEQLLAYGALGWLMAGTDDKDDPWITGSKPPYSNRGEVDFMYRNLPPQSIKIGDRWFSYARIEPFAGMLTTMVDGIQAFRDAKNDVDARKIFTDVFNSGVSNVRDKTFLRGVGDLIRAVEDPENALRYTSNFVSSWIPNAVRKVVSAADDEIKDNRTYERTLAGITYHQLFELPGSKAGLVDLKPKVDLWGNTITKDENFGDFGDFAWRVISPVYADKAESMKAVDKFVWNWNQNNPNDQYWPTMPQWWFKRNNKTVYMTAEQYNRYARSAGKLARRNIEIAIREGLIKNINKPSSDDLKIYKKMISDARRDVKKVMFPKSGTNNK